ncbi:MAG: hypothetical protein ACQUHE_02330 [Bacteroidia bacterium]
MEITLTQATTFYTLIYFIERIKPLYLAKAIHLLYLADKMAIKQTGVPVTWFDYDISKLIPKLIPKHEYLINAVLIAPATGFDDSQFCDYDIDVFDFIIREYGNFDVHNMASNIRFDYVTELAKFIDTDYKKSAFEVAYQSYVMEKEKPSNFTIGLIRL